MKNQPIQPTDVLNRISGFHQYHLDAPRHLRYVSDNLCVMLGASESVLLTELQDGYLPYLHPEDREVYETFVRELGQRAQTKALQYRLVDSKGQTLHVLDTMTSYRRNGHWMADSVLTDMTGQRQERLQQEAEHLRRENDSLKHIQAMAMQFTEGMLAFELEDGRVKPLYTSENVCSFFGYTQEQWSTLAQNRPTFEEFIAGSGMTYMDVLTLFSKGEAEFPYFDIHRNAYRRIRAICSRKYDGTGKCYVMLYRMDAPRQEQSEPIVRIRTFGYFDVFVGEKPIAFRNEKAKELFALLVDRKGGFVTSEEAIGFLWEDEPANSLTMARYRKVALRLKNTLEEYGVADIMESVNGKRRLISERVKCDLYDYLSGDEAYAQLFKGSYLTNYSWAESTLAELTGAYLYGQDE